MTKGIACTLPLSGTRLLHVRDSGTEFAAGGTATPIRDADDQMLGAVLIFRNITERRRTEQELLKLGKQESLGQLAGRIAHDFNNLLTVILGNLSLAKILLAPGDAALRRLADTEKACLRAKDLTRQLLAFARGGLPVKKPLALEPLVRESTRLILQDANVPTGSTGPTAAAGQRRRRAAPPTPLRTADQRHARHAHRRVASTCAGNASSSTTTARCRCPAAITCA